jgi:hypothetical protein
LATLKALTVAALVLAAVAATALKADDTNGGDSSIAVVSWANKLIPLFICCRHYNLHLY